VHGKHTALHAPGKCKQKRNCDAKSTLFLDDFVACLTILTHVTCNEMASDQEGLEQSKRSSNQSELSLVDLPESVLALVAQRSRSTCGHPLLQSSRVARDAVLSCSSTVSLRLAGGEHAPEARLLDRVCSTAPHGLELELDLLGASKSSKPLLQLVKPGLSTGGWTHVHKLKVSILGGGTATG
jgi:hypothetical protein